MKGRQQNIVLIVLAILLNITDIVVSASKESVSSLPMWKQVFVNYTTWSGQYSYNNTVYGCRLGVLSVKQFVKVSFVDRSTHIDLLGFRYAPLDKVIFNMTDIFQTNERIQANVPFQLAGKLTWSSSKNIWTYVADVTLPHGKPFSTFTLTSITESVSSLPMWKQVFVNYTTWSGQYSYNNTVYGCRLGVLSVKQFVKVSFVDRSTHIDLLGFRYAPLDKVIFNMTDIFQTNERIQANVPFQLAGKLTWSSSKNIWTYVADVTLPHGKPFSTFTLTSITDESTESSSGSRTRAIVLGIVFTLAILGVVLMVGALIWSHRKGLLRHIPMSYRTFKNPKEERRASFDSREETVHI